MNVGDIVGVAIGLKLVNGKIKPKYGASAIIGMAVMLLLLILFIFTFIDNLINFNINYIAPLGAAIFGVIYLLLITPYTQKSSNYHIEFQNENTLDGFKLSYKGDLVNIDYKLDKSGKIAFANNSNKLSCISYADGSHMSNFVKHKIINYFCKWLNDNNLFSSEITTTFEEL